MSGYRDTWSILGIARTADVAAIRAAYARVLKSFDVDAEPQRFMALRNARDHALRLARQQAAAPLDVVDAEGHADADASEGGPAEVPERGDEATLKLVTPALPDAAQITAHVAQEATGGTVSTAIPAAPEGDYRNDAAPPVTPDSGDGIPLPDLTTRATLALPVIDAARRRGAIGIAINDTAHEALIDRHYDAVRRLLAPHYGRAAQETYLDATEELALAGHMDALLGDPRLEQIAFREQAAAWFAEMAANAVPRSDSIVERLVATFGWAADRGRIDQPHNIARVLARRDSLVFFRLVQDRKHPLNAAWRELVRPAEAGSRRGFRVNRGEVQRLLKVVRENFPDLESCFDWYRVSLWEAPSRVRRTAGAWRPAYFGLILLLGVLRVVFADYGDTPPPVHVPHTTAWSLAGLTDPANATSPTAEDVTTALGGFTGGKLTFDILHRGNPAFARHLDDELKKADDARTDRKAFLHTLDTELEGRIRGGLARAPYDLIAAWRRLERDRLTATRQRDPALCGLTANGAPLPDLGVAFEDRRTALIRRVLTETFAPVVPADHTARFTVPGEVVTAGAARAALSRRDFVAALGKSQNWPHVCAARIGLLETVLALPPAQGLTLLRKM